MSPNASITPLPTATPAETRRALRALLGARWGAVVAGAGVLTAAAIAGLALPAVLGGVVDAVVDRDPSRLPLLLAVLVGAGLAQAVLAGLGRLLVARLGEAVLAELRERVVARLLRLPAARLELAGSGDLVSRASGDARIVGDAVSNVLPTFAGAASSIVITVVGLGIIDVRFALAALAAVPIQVLATRRYLRRARPAYLAARTAAGERSRRLLESIEAADTVRAYDVAAAREQHIDAAAAAEVEREIAAARVSVGFWNRLNFAEFAGLAAVLAVGFALVSADAATIGGATSAALYFHALFGPIGAVLGGVDDLQKASAALSRMTGVLELPERERERPGSARRRVPAAVSLQSVAYTHAGGFRIADVTLELEAGRTTAVVGPSGAGKSTIAALVLGSLEAEAGRIVFAPAADRPSDTADEGAPGDAASTGSTSLRPRVGLAGQEPHVFAATVAENLRLARPDAPDDALLHALDEVGAGSWAARMPHGLETVVGSGGHALSPLESQQLALARLVLHDPDVLVLDEATAAARGASALDAAVARLASGRTTLTIAHRLDQAERADRVAVMDSGRLVETGTHSELLSRGGRYAELWAAWSRGRGA